jgi:hypothetical protein
MFRDGGIYRELTRRLQWGLIAIDLMRSLEFKTAFITQEFWLSEEAYRTAQNAPAQSVLARLFVKTTMSCLDLGLFVFPPRIDHQWQDISTTAVAHCVQDHGREDA